MDKKRRVNEESLKNLEKGAKFSKTNQPTGKAKSEGKQKKIAERRENERSAEILNRFLEKVITNSKTGEEMTQKEAMLYGVIHKAIKEKDLKAVELILKITNDMPAIKQEILSANLTMQKVFITEKETKKADKHIDSVLNG